MTGPCAAKGHLTDEPEWQTRKLHQPDGRYKTMQTKQRSGCSIGLGKTLLGWGLRKPDR